MSLLLFPLICLGSLPPLTWSHSLTACLWKFPDTNILFTHVSPQLLLSLFYWLSPLLIPYSKFSLKSCASPSSLPSLYFLSGQAYSDSWFENTLLSNIFPTFISSPDPLLEFQGSNSTQPKSVSMSLSNLHYLSQINGTAIVQVQKPKSSSLLSFPRPLSTFSLLNSTSIMDHSQVGSPFASLLPCIPGVSLSPVFFQFILYIMSRVIFLAFSDSSLKLSVQDSP